MSKIRDAFKRAQHHGEQLGTHLHNALDAHVYADSDALGKHLRAAERSQDLLKAAHRDLEAAIGTGHDPAANPSAAMGAQTSDGQSPRAFTPDQIRQRDQLAGCRAGYEARMRALGRIR